MGFKIKNSLTGEFEKLPILTLKGEKGETGGVEEYNKVDYMGNKYETLKQANDANVEYAVKTAIGEFNYLDYDGQHITATDTIAGQAKNAVVKGNTLVNLLSNKYNYINLPTSEEVEMNSAVNTYNAPDVRVKRIKLNQTLQANKKYILLLNVVSLENGKSIGGLTTSASNEEDYNIPRFSNTGLQYKIFETKFEVKEICLYLDFNETTPSIAKIKQPVLMEYQEGMENWDIPYFEGMQSVKLPVLTTTGKNLFNSEVEIGGIDNSTGEPNYSINTVRSKNLINVKENTTYTISNDKNYNNYIYFYSAAGIFISYLAGRTNPFTFTTPSGTSYIKTRTTGAEIQNDVTIKWQLEKSSSASSYEPYKSNILTVNEEVELRGIGDVKDELDLTTGKLTQRICEVALDGSESWKVHNTYGYVLNVANLGIKNINTSASQVASNFMCDSLPTVSLSELTSKNKNGISPSVKDIDEVLIYFTDIGENNLTGLRQKLASNPITIIAELKQPSIKTVDLSDNHVYSYKGTTHYDCSSAEGSLVPTLSVKVPTDVQATIAQQRETIQTLNSENERLNQIQEALKASMLDSQVQLMNLSWDTDFEVFTLRESIAPKDFLMDSRTGSNIDKFSQAKFIIENDCPDLEKLNSQIEYYFSKDVFSQEQFEELTDLISIVKGENGCEY